MLTISYLLIVTGLITLIIAETVLINILFFSIYICLFFFSDESYNSYFLSIGIIGVFLGNGYEKFDSYKSNLKLLLILSIWGMDSLLIREISKNRSDTVHYLINYGFVRICIGLV